MNAMSLLMGALNQWRIIAIAAALAFAAMQSHRITVARADLAALNQRYTQSEALLTTCETNAETARKTAEASINAAHDREAEASAVAARQTEKAIALARLKAPVACADGMAWTTAQARLIAQEWKE